MDRTIRAKDGVREITADEKGFLIRFPLDGEDSVIVNLTGGSWPSGLVVTPVGSADGAIFETIPDLDACTALGWQETANVQGLAEFGLRLTTAGAAGFVAVAVRGHKD